MKCECITLLSQDHKIILRGLDVLEHMAMKVEQGETIAPNDLDTLLRFLRLFADDYHQAKEESALFPVLIRTKEAEKAVMRHILFEHDQERSLVEGLEESLRTRKGKDFVHYATRLVALIRNHIYKEDQILFAIVESALSASDDRQIVAEFEKFQVEPGLLTALHRLEWIYIRKTA